MNEEQVDELVYWLNELAYAVKYKLEKSAHNEAVYGGINMARILVEMYLTQARESASV